jgi:hypothetical protein
MMNFKEWLKNFDIKEGGFISSGKASNSLFKPGPRDIKPKPRDVKLCGTAGGPGPCAQ